MRSVHSVYYFVRRHWPKIGPFVTLFSLSSFFQLRLEDVVTATQTVGPYVLQARVSWLLVAAVSTYFWYVEIRHRNTPLTVLHTDIEFFHETPSGSRVRRVATQRVRANHEDVTGYHRRIIAPDGGSIPQSGYVTSIDHCGSDKQEVLWSGTESNWEIIHTFDPIPARIRWLGTNHVVRRESTLFVDAFLKEEERFTIALPSRYRHKRLTVTVYFHPARPCNLADFKALRITQNGVSRVDFVQIPPERYDQGVGIRIDIRKPREGDEFQLRWKYQPVGPSALAVLGMTGAIALAGSDVRTSADGST